MAITWTPNYFCKKIWALCKRSGHCPAPGWRCTGPPWGCRMPSWSWRRLDLWPLGQPRSASFSSPASRSGHWESPASPYSLPAHLPPEPRARFSSGKAGGSCHKPAHISPSASVCPWDGELSTLPLGQSGRSNSGKLSSLGGIKIR